VLAGHRRQFGWDENESHANCFAESVSSWRPFPDTVEALHYLSRFYKLGILSNVDNASFAGRLKLLEIPFLFTVTAEDVGSYKPAKPHFDAAFARLAEFCTERSELLHVAQSKHHDITPGNAFGLWTVWVNRRHNKTGTGATLAATAEPTLTVNSLAELVGLHKAGRIGSSSAA
jgi:2-haloacid dehalogenase